MKELFNTALLDEKIDIAYEVASKFIGNFTFCNSLQSIQFKFHTTILNEEDYKKELSIMGFYTYHDNKVTLNLDNIAYTAMDCELDNEGLAGLTLSTLAHELGHAAHANLMNEDFLEHDIAMDSLSNKHPNEENILSYQEYTRHMENQANYFASKMFLPEMEKQNGYVQDFFLIAKITSKSSNQSNVIKFFKTPV